jgi:NTP pyrophosphatase (non-canonical NTP hydrolase)
MPTLTEMQIAVCRLVKTKKFYDQKKHIPHKLLFLLIEVGEAANAWKKGKSSREIIEELIDCVFYIVDVAYLIEPDINLDEVFSDKLHKNLKREVQYGEDHRIRSKRDYKSESIKCPKCKSEKIIEIAERYGRYLLMCEKCSNNFSSYGGI